MINIGKGDNFETAIVVFLHHHKEMFFEMLILRRV